MIGMVKPKLCSKALPKFFKSELNFLCSSIGQISFKAKIKISKILTAKATILIIDSSLNALLKSQNFSINPMAVIHPAKLRKMKIKAKMFNFSGVKMALISLL